MLSSIDLQGEKAATKGKRAVSKIILLWLVALLMVAAIAGCSNTVATPQAQPVEQEENAQATQEEKIEMHEAEKAAEAVQKNDTIILSYAHPNNPNSITGIFADTFAQLVEEKTGGKVVVEVYPSSQLGSLQEMVEKVQDGTIAFHHNTMAAIGALYPDFAAFDTPYLYQDVDHLLKVTTMDSPIMQDFNKELTDARGVRLITTFYFGTRHLTADREIKTPDDLQGVKIRSIPFPIYTAAVEGMGAIATPIDWTQVPAALSGGEVNGQENPVDVIYNHKLYETQSYLMLTGHIKATDAVVINEAVWQALTPEIQNSILEAAQEAGAEATQSTIQSEAEFIEKLKEAGMKVIGPDEGLDIEAFETQVTALVEKRFGDKYDQLYQDIRAIE